MPKDKCCADDGRVAKKPLNHSKEMFGAASKSFAPDDAIDPKSHVTKDCQMLKALTYHRAIDQVPKTAPATTNNYRSEEEKIKKNIRDTLAVGKSLDKRTSTSGKELSLMQELCNKLNCPQLSYQIEKLTAAQEQLVRMQHRQLFDEIFGPNFICFCSKAPAVEGKRKLKKANSEILLQVGEAEKLGEEEQECICFGSEGELMELLPENEWHGYFRGYETLCEVNDFSLDEIKKCIEIGHLDTVESIEGYLRAGVRCFMMDLFKGNNYRNQSLVVRFRQSELNVAKELGFPITSTLFVRLSPRLQYTGYLERPFTSIVLSMGEYVTLTTDRYWACQCSKRRIFVNARYLVQDTSCCDIILIGGEIQLMVSRIANDSLRCKVIRGGILRSRMPVLFNRRCHRFQMSYCELEDITFVKEVGINVIVSDMLGSRAYFDNLCASLKLLRCENLRIYARVVLNNIDDDVTNVDWAAEAYDGFIGEIGLFRDGCGGDGNIISFENLPFSRILFLNPQISELIESAHRLHKPFIFDPTPLVKNYYVMDPCSYRLILYHPDKYLVSANDDNQMDDMSLFYMLANALGSSMPEEELQLQMPYCDESHTGSDTLALSAVAASLEMEASCIFVVGLTGRMVTKIASFRPKATIYFISGLKSIANFVSIHHNVVMLYYNTAAMMDGSHQKSVYTQFLFGLSYALKLKTLRDGDHVIFVYGQKPGQLFLDKYVAYKFEVKNFIRELAKILF